MGIIPVMRVNYTLTQLVWALLINDNKDIYRRRLETQIRDFFDVDNVALTSSCRTATYMLLKTLPQKKVIVPAYTCGVVVEAALLANKEIIFEPVNPDDLNAVSYSKAGPDSIVIATHQYGIPCNIKRIVSDCHKVGALVIEDCAGSFGASEDGQLTGTFGDYGVFSLSASKTLHSPTKGGFIISKTNTIPKYLSNGLRTHDIKFKVAQILKGIGFCLNKSPIVCNVLSRLYNHHRKVIAEVNSNVKMEQTYYHPFYEWQAYIVSKQFDEIRDIIARRKELELCYNQCLNNPFIKQFRSREGDVRIRYAVLVQNRKKFVNQARKEGIQIECGYDVIYCPTMFQQERIVIESIVYLPFGNCYTDKEIKRVIDFVNNYRV